MQKIDNYHEKHLERALDLFNKHKQTEFTVIVIGPTGSGKSTLSNGLINDKNLFFESKKGSGTFNPKQTNVFPISSDLTQSKTRDPQFQQINQEFSLWDVPGFGDSRSVDIDIHTNIFANLLFNSGKQVLILLLIQRNQISQGKCSQLVEILNMIKEANVSIILGITKTDKKDKIHDIISILNKLIENQETKMERQSQDLLQQIIATNKVLLIKKPLPTTTDPNIYELYKQDIDQLFDKVFNKDHCRKSTFQIKFSKESKEYLEKQMSQYKLMYEQQQKLLLKSEITLKLSQTSFSKIRKKQFDNIRNDQLQKQEEFTKCIKAYNTIAKLIQTYELTPNEYQENCKKIDQLITSGQTDKIQGEELYIQGIQTTSSQVMGIYQKYIDANMIITSIFIYSQQGFCIDQNLILPGINLYIKTQNFHVNQQSEINLKGNKGKPQPKAFIVDDILPQSLKGTPGQNGGCLYIDAENSYNLELLTINLSGGDGGDGQDGADGENGKDGEDGNYQMVYDKDPGCDFHFEEEPFNLAEVFLTFNRSFKCFYKSQGKCGSIGGNSRRGGLGGCVGQKGLSQFNISQQAFLNIIDTQSELGEQGQDGEPGKGGKQGISYEGVEQQTKIFGRTRDLKNLEKKQDNLVEGAAGNLATGAIGTAAGVGVVQVLKVVAEEFAALSLRQVLKGAAVGATSVASFAVALVLQIAGTGIQILHSDHKWIEPPHPVDNYEYAESGQVMDNDTIIEQKDIDAQIQQQRQEFQEKICKFNQFQCDFIEYLRKEYPIQELHESLFGDAYQETAK